MVSLWRRSRLAQARQQGMHVRQVDVAFGLGAPEQQVHQRVVRQVQQAGQRIDLVIIQIGLMRIEEAREDQVVFEQATACTPAQAGTIGRVGLMREFLRFHTRVRCWVNTILRLPGIGSTVLLLYL